MSLWRDSLGCVTASMETNTSAGCATLLVPLLATACATLLAASFASPLEVRKHARMAKPALRCASLTLNAATCELNGYGKAAEFLLVDAPPPCGTTHAMSRLSPEFDHQCALLCCASLALLYMPMLSFALPRLNCCPLLCFALHCIALLDIAVL